MAHPLSTLGIFHTAITVFALIIAAVSLIQTGNLSPKTRLGMTYIVCTVIGCLTAFGIAKTGHFGKGHVLAGIILALVAVGVVVKNKYVQTIALTTTLFLSLIPATLETLTRLPLGHPFAPGPDAPIAKNTLLVWAILFGIGSLLQILNLRKIKLS